MPSFFSIVINETIKVSKSEYNNVVILVKSIEKKTSSPGIAFKAGDISEITSACE
jgi:hypothetical protein